MTDTLYPLIDAYHSGYVTVSEHPRHQLWVEQYGNPDGEPVLFIHGGPGAAGGPIVARFFDPQRFRIINYHQRGAGRSLPFLNLDDNTTPHLIADIITLREKLGITGKMHVFGGSWGSFLGLMYALNHPDTVASLTLRGIFLGRACDIDAAYQRDALAAPDSWHSPALTFPDAWRRFVDFIPPAERGDMFSAYYDRIHTPGPQQLAASREWYRWEDATLRLHPLSQVELDGNLADGDAVMSQVIMETHYFRHGCFLDSYGGDDFILKVAPIARIPTTIVQGHYDQCTPRGMADELVAALNAARADIGAEPVDYVLTVAGHIAFDAENPAALADAMRRHPPIV